MHESQRIDTRLQARCIECCNRPAGSGIGRPVAHAAEDQIWKALGDATRRSLLDDLATQPQTTGDLVARHPELCRTAVMKHLAILETAGLVVVRREGRFRWNYINPVPIERICSRWIRGHVRHLSAAVNRLRKFVHPTES